MADELIALITFALVSTASPGGATSLATASGAQFGFKRSLPLIFGIALTLALLVAVSGTGLSAAILAVPSLEFVMKLIGTVYLLWLAFVVLRSGPPNKTTVSAMKPIGFVEGGALLVINPKAWAMAMGVVGSFSSIADNAYTLAGIFAATFAVSATISLSIWALVGASLARLLYADWQWHLFNLVMAILLALAIISFWL